MVMKSLKLSSVQDKSKIVLKPSGLDYNDHAHKLLDCTLSSARISTRAGRFSAWDLQVCSDTWGHKYIRERCGNTFSALTDLIWGPSLYSVVHATPLSKFPFRDQ